MSKFILSSVRLFAGGVDLTGAGNKLQFQASRDEKDATTWASVDAAGNPWKEVLGGLGSASLDASGFWEAGDPTKVDDASWANLGTVVPITASPSLQANPGDLAWVMAAHRSEYSLGDQVGGIAPWSGKWGSSSPLARGVMLHAPGTARTVTGTGAAVQYVAPTAAQRVYACLHVLSVAGTAGPSLTVKVQSDAAAAFTTPVDVATFTAATAVGGQALSAPGVPGDAWYRVSWTIAGTAPSFLFAVSVGVA